MSANPTTRILIIDDDDAVLTAQQRLLACAGYDVRVAGGPYEGLDSIRDWQPDLVLLDLLMPTVSGFEAVQVFKRATMKDALLVAFSGMILPQDETGLRGVGFDDVLPKPYPAHEFVSRIEAILARHRARQNRRIL